MPSTESTSASRDNAVKDEDTESQEDKVICQGQEWKTESQVTPVSLLAALLNESTLPSSHLG